MVSEVCSVCSVFLGSSKRTKLTEIVELLETLLVRLNINLLEELIICESCIIKVQSACKFKASYLENSQHSFIKEEDIEDETVCEICKGNVNPIDCIPLFFSVTEKDKLNLFKFLSSELQLKSQDSPQTCELCHNSILNFCMVIKSFSAFAQDKISNETVTDLESMKSNSGYVINVNSVVSTDECKMDIKEENTEEKEDQVPVTTYEDFLCKNEEVDLKMEDEPSSNNKDTERSSTLQCPGYSTVDRNDSYMTADIIKIDMSYNECGNADEKCSNCEFQTNYTNNLCRHVSIHKNLSDIDNLQCQNWKFQMKNNPYVPKHVFVHKNIINDKIFKCHNCQFQTQYKGALKHHMLIHKGTTDDIERFKCLHCQYQTKRKGNLKKHTLIHKDTNEVKMFKCQNCQYQTKYKSALKQHILIHKDTNEIEMFQCQHCQFQTKRKSTLKQHMLIHKDANEVEMFTCQHCKFQTKYKYYLKEHIRLIHNKPKKMFKCQNCQFQTIFQSALNQHVTRDHYIEVEIFKCQHCWYQTKHKDDLKEHMLIHNKPLIPTFFKCEKCQYQTKYKQHLTRHMFIHKDTKVKLKCSNV